MYLLTYYWLTYYLLLTTYYDNNKNVFDSGPKENRMIESEGLYILPGAHGPWSRDILVSKFQVAWVMAWVTWHTTILTQTWTCHWSPTVISTHPMCLTHIRYYFGNLFATTTTTISVHPQPPTPTTMKERAREREMRRGLGTFFFFSSFSLLLTFAYIK